MGEDGKYTRDGVKQQSATTGAQHEVSARGEDGTRPKQIGHAAKPKESGDGARPKNVTGAAAKADSRDDDVTGTKENPKGSPSGGAGSMELVDRLDLPFEACMGLAFSSNGSILLEDKSDPHHYLYERRAGKYSLVWKKATPSNMRCCFIAVHRTEILLQRVMDTDTIQYSRDLQKQKTFQRKGLLLGCTDDGHVLYCRGTPYERDWTIDVWNERKCMMTLRHPSIEGRVSGSKKRDGWGQYFSACTVSDNLAVVESRSVSLDIFTKQGKRVHHCDLGYKPHFPRAVTAFGTKHVIIAEYDTDIVHVHSLDGREVGRHELGLQRGDRVWGVCYSTDGVLHVAVGPNTPPWRITSLRAYKLV